MWAPIVHHLLVTHKKEEIFPSDIGLHACLECNVYRMTLVFAFYGTFVWRWWIKVNKKDKNRFIFKVTRDLIFLITSLRSSTQMTSVNFESAMEEKIDWRFYWKDKWKCLITFFSLLNFISIVRRNEYLLNESIRFLFEGNPIGIVWFNDVFIDETVGKRFFWIDLDCCLEKCRLHLFNRTCLLYTSPSPRD